MAKEHRNKLSHICPVWYQLRLQHGAPYLSGGHDVDAGWMGDLRERASDVCPQQSFPSVTKCSDRGSACVCDHGNQ